jgi:hypothetical protein
MSRGWAALGAVAAAVGLAAVVEPRLVAGLSTPSLLVVLLGGLALLQSFRLGWRRLRDTTRESLPALPAVERRELSMVPGEEFDEALRGALVASYGGPSRKQAVRQELEETAVAVLERYDGLGPEEARERLATGAWTEDRFAAAFFSPRVSSELTFRERLRVRAAGEAMFGRQAAAVTAALQDRVEAGRDAERPSARARAAGGDDESDASARTRTHDHSELSLEEIIDPSAEPEGES